MKIILEISAGTVHNIGPNIEILVNQVLIYDLILAQKNTIDIQIDNSIDNTIEIVHKNKFDNDTIICDGKIVADKFFIVDKIWVDDILLPNILCYTERHNLYPKDYLGIRSNDLIANNLYFNGKLKYLFMNNFFMWLYEYFKKHDEDYAYNHSDPEANQKFFGYNQESSCETQIIKILESRGYSITD
jgi:hypothetical protein